jgi:mannuronan synthase
MTSRLDPTLLREATTERPLEAPPGFHGGNEHPLIDIPFSVYVDGRQYSGEGISLVEAQVKGLADPALENQERLVRIAFDFGGFGVSLHPKVLILRDSPQRLVLRFTEPTGDHLPQLRHILNDYISGDLTALGTVIRAVPHPIRLSSGAQADGLGWPGTLRRVVGTLVVLALTLLLLGVAGLLLGQRLLVTRLEAPAQVTLAGETLRAVADGQVSFLDPAALQGEPAFSIATTSGETLSIAMPCDCEGVPAGVAEGSTVLAGEPILTLVQGERSTVVEASVPADRLFDLQRLGGAEIRLADGTRAFGRLAASPPALPGEDVVPVQLVPEPPIPAEMAGQAVELRLRSEPSSLLDRLRDGWDALSSLWT